MSTEKPDCVVAMEEAIIDHVGTVTEYLGRNGWPGKQATAFIADRVGRAAGIGLELGAATVRWAKATEEEHHP